MFAYVGSRTTKERNATGKGISVYEVHGHDWKLIQVVGDLVNPSFQCFDETSIPSTVTSAKSVLSNGTGRRGA